MVRTENVFEMLESRFFLSAGGVKVLIDEHFNGPLDGHVWHEPLYRPDGSTFLGRTQLRVSQNTSLPKVKKGAVRLNLDSYNPTMLPGLPSFYGTEIESNKAFMPTSNTAIDVAIRAKLNQRTPGIVGGLFLYNVRSATDHDEVDTELISNQIAGANQPETNLYTSEGFGAGSPEYHSFPSGGKLTGYHTYGMTWYTNRVVWRIDGKVVRVENVAPQHPSQVFINIWAPNSGWQAAYSDKIQPVTSARLNKRYSMDVDRVLVRSRKIKSISNGGGGGVGGNGDSSSYTVGASSGTAPNVPVIQLDKVPKYASAKSDLHGSVANVNPANYNVAVLTKVSGKWWTKPTFDGRVISIASNGTWQTDIISGGTDQYATDVAAFLVPSGTDIPSISASDALPDSLMQFTHVIFRRPTNKIGGDGTPDISFTSIPAINTSDNLSGIVSHVSPSDYQIALFINPWGWWTKPYFDYPGIAINPDGTWSTPYNTGGVDASATELVVYLLPVDYVIPMLGGSSGLPAELGQKAVAYKVINR